VSILPSTLAVPYAVSQEILSLSARISSTATDPNPTVSVHIITDEVFAISLPLHNGIERTTPKSGLPLAAEIGIGVGAGLLILITLGIVFWVFASRRRRNQTLGGDSRTGEWAEAQQQRKSLTSVTTAHTSAAYPSGTTHPGHGSTGWQQPGYFRTPPPRQSFQPMPVTHSGSPYKPGDANYGPTYTELPGDYSAPVEADGIQVQYSDYDMQPTHQPADQGYSQQGRFYGQQQEHIDNNQSRRNEWI
jgi:hypothetical protein